jgi:hypothetical protein
MATGLRWSISASSRDRNVADHNNQEGANGPLQPRRKICIAIPSYSGMGHMRTHFALLDGILDLASRGWEFTYMFRDHDSMIARARSVMVTNFLYGEQYKDATDLVMIDSDLSWQFGGLGRICAHDVDVVGGAYPFKVDDLRFPIKFLDRPSELGPDGIMEVRGVTPGFFRMTRRVLERMTEVYHEELSFAERDVPGGTSVMLFENCVRRSGVSDEGFIFCERWRRLGGKVWCDPEIKMTHWGTKGFDGMLGDWLRDRTKPSMSSEEINSRRQAIAAIETSLAAMEAIPKLNPLIVDGVQYGEAAE